MDPYMDVAVHFDLQFTPRGQASALIHRRWAHHIFLSRLHKKKNSKDEGTFTEPSIELESCPALRIFKSFLFLQYVIYFIFFKVDNFDVSTVCARPTSS